MGKTGDLCGNWPANDALRGQLYMGKTGDLCGDFSLMMDEELSARY
jgi:hypothetical protein